MTWHGREASEWMQALGGDESDRASSPRSSYPELPPEEDARVERLARLIEAGETKVSRTRKSWVVAAGGSLAVAAGALLALSFTDLGDEKDSGLASVHDSSGGFSVVLERAGERTKVERDSQFQAGDRLHSSGSFSLRFAQGALVALDGASIELVQSPGREGVELDAGRVDLTIPKQKEGQTWTVTTKTAQVTVVGTEFSVWLADDGGAEVTCVAVAEGKVRAESSAHSKLLSVGEVWASAPRSQVCGPRTPGESNDNEQAAPESAEATPTPVQPEVKSASGKRPPVAVPGSSLAEQNELFVKIVQARREGNRGETKRLGNSFLTRYPRSPLAGQVRSEMRRVEQGTD